MMSVLVALLLCARSSVPCPSPIPDRLSCGIDLGFECATGSRMLTAVIVLLRAIGLLCRGHRAVALENLALRQQLTALTRTRTRPHLRMSDRLFWIGLAHAWRDWRRARGEAKIRRPRALPFSCPFEATKTGKLQQQ